MDKLETPWNFNVEKKIYSNSLKYVNLMEICQGGPEIGEILINNTKIYDYKFGGPSLFNNHILIIPVYVNSFFSKGFKIAIINLSDYSIKILGKVNDLIILKEFDATSIIYYSDINKSKLRKIEY